MLNMDARSKFTLKSPALTNDKYRGNIQQGEGTEMDGQKGRRQILTFEQLRTMRKRVTMGPRKPKATRPVGTSATEHHARVIWNVLRENRLRPKMKARRKTTVKTAYNTRQSIPEPIVVSAHSDFPNSGGFDVTAQTMIPER